MAGEIFFVRSLSFTFDLSIFFCSFFVCDWGRFFVVFFRFFDKKIKLSVLKKLVAIIRILNTDTSRPTWMP